MGTAAILQLVLALLGAVPQALAAAEAIKADLSTTDQATLNTAIASAQASTLAAVAQAEADLAAAAKV